MPYYRWRGVELTGDIKKGILFARSVDHLDHLLLKREIALLSYTVRNRWITKSITLADRVKIFSQLATLIEAGILVPDALDIIAHQVDHVKLQDIMHQIAKQVAEGTSLSTALSMYSPLANHVIIQLIKAGEESGQLAHILGVLCKHLQAMHDFYRRIKSALLLPAITLVFFMSMLLIIFIGILPRFMIIFTSMGKEVPPLTQFLIQISHGIQNPWVGLIGALVLLMILLIWRMLRYGNGRRIRDGFLMKIPIVGSLLQQQFLAYVMEALSVLLGSGIPLYEALKIVSSSVQNHIFLAQLKRLEADIQSGSSLSDAMARHVNGIFSQDIVAMVEVAESTGRLALLLQRISQVYYTRVTERLAWLTIIIQPAIMIILGLLVALLIFAVYEPIFTLSSAF